MSGGVAIPKVFPDCCFAVKCGVPNSRCGARPEIYSGVNEMRVRAECRFGVFAAFLLVAMLAAGPPLFDAFGAPNPVLPGVADAGVLRFNGQYFLMGVGTAGGFFVSDDLVHWTGPKHAFSMDNAWAKGDASTDDNIHACDISLVNGQFNLYWSVNRGDLRQIGRAVADNILGPYTEPKRERPFDGRIDPNLFLDDDGAAYFYTAKFDVGNWVWGQGMSDPGALKGEPLPLLTPIPGTWELQDEPVNEGPCVRRYRDSYYMLYNANHTALRYGNYALGCAVAKGPLDFSNSCKYAYAVLEKTQPSPAAAVAVANCGQPNLVRGPNWFEWWLAYFAVYDGNPVRAQAVDRVLFLDRELLIDGPTTSATSGTHPDPAPPAFRDLFDRDGPLAGPWLPAGGDWSVTGGEARQTNPSGLCRATMTVPAATNYMFESGLRFLDKDSRQAGIIAWENGRESAIYVGLNRRENTWFWVRRRGFVIRTEVFPLSNGFNWDGWHHLAVLKNGCVLEVLLDGIPAPGNPSIPADDCGAGRPGLVTRNGAAAFDGVVHALGWDEYDAAIRGWSAAACGSPVAGVWGADGRGLIAEPASGEARAFKGDLTGEGEFSVQLRPEQAGAGIECGAYPVYADEDNFVRVALDEDMTRVSVSGKCGGTPIPGLSAIITPRARRAASLREGGCNLRALRLDNRLVLFVDGVETLAVPGAWPPAQVGLFAAGAPCRFNGITCYARGKAGAPPAQTEQGRAEARP